MLAARISAYPRGGYRARASSNLSRVTGFPAAHLIARLKKTRRAKCPGELGREAKKEMLLLGAQLKVGIDAAGGIRLHLHVGCVHGDGGVIWAGRSRGAGTANCQPPRGRGLFPARGSPGRRYGGAGGGLSPISSQ